MNKEENKALNDKYIDSIIDEKMFHVFPGTTTTVCCVKVKNGFCFTGTASCVDADMYLKSVGEFMSYEKAKQKIAEMVAYLEKDDTLTFYDL